MSGPERESNNPYESPRRQLGRDASNAPPSGSIVKSIIAAIVGIVCAIYLINPTLGVFELIPDNLPVVGNLDEATATALLLSSLAYFGWDLRTLFGRRGSSIENDRRTIDHRGPSNGE
jgi:Protein of unknown function (DUF1232)